MKKILFLLILCIIKLNAYEYLLYEYSNAADGQNKYFFYVDSSGTLLIRRVKGDGTTYVYLDKFYPLCNIRRRSANWVGNNVFQSYYINDLDFLNDLYTQSTQPFLNYLYNPNNNFNSRNYINYENYQILYNSNGLAVESIVDGVWAGLYDDSQKTRSGALYDKNGSMVYYNGKEVTPAISFFVWLQKFTNNVVIEVFEEIQRSFVAGMIAAVVLVLAIVRLVLELLPSSITPCRRRYYGGGRGSLPDFGDGRQVSASVRARLAAKNQALKARAYDRSGVEESIVNGILFDLENDR